MNHQTFNEVVAAQIARCEEILGLKSAEYSTADKLHNFKVAAGLQQCTPEAACGGMMAKHMVSVYDLIRRLEPDRDPTPMELWDEKLTDAINYLLLLKALLVERASNMIEITISYNARATDTCIHCHKPIYLDSGNWRHADTLHLPCNHLVINGPTAYPSS